MKRYLPQLACVLCLLLGLSIGWYSGYTRPALHTQRLYDAVQRETGMSDREIVRAVPEALAAIKREDESVALVSLKAVGMLDRGAIEKTKSYLVYWVGSYYQAYRTNGDSNLLANIEAASTDKYSAGTCAHEPAAGASCNQGSDDKIRGRKGLLTFAPRNSRQPLASSFARGVLFGEAGGVGHVQINHQHPGDGVGVGRALGATGLLAGQRLVLPVDDARQRAQ